MVNYKNFVTEHKTALIFAGGIATAIIGKKIIESQAFKDTTSKAMASVMSAKQNAENAMAEIKADAEEQITEGE